VAAVRLVVAREEPGVIRVPVLQAAAPEEFQEARMERMALMAPTRVAVAAAAAGTMATAPAQPRSTTAHRLPVAPVAMAVGLAATLG
jgi:hypothetical protein